MERSKFDTLPPEYQQALAEYVAEAEQSASDAESALAQGMAAVAYHRAWDAASGMEMVNLMANSWTSLHRHRGAGGAE